MHPRCRPPVGPSTRHECRQLQQANGALDPHEPLALIVGDGFTVPIAEAELQPTAASRAGAALHNEEAAACSTRLPLIMDKFLLQQQVLDRLAEDLLQAEQAARAAHETATHEESIAENKYDTLGLEAAYLATGQARRAEAIGQAMANWRQFRPRAYDASRGIQLGALVCLVDSNDQQQQLFLGPDGGSMKLLGGARLVQVISSEAPLGQAMLGKREGDEVSIQVGPVRLQLEVLRVD
jgi:transcription elongation GreA/GreB family factor